MILAAFLVGCIFVGLVHGRSARRVVVRYLQEHRPEVVSAIESYKAEHGKYPDRLTDVIVLNKVEFIEQYEYSNYATNYSLKQF